MAFDLVGKDPLHYDGEWIRFNVWSWHRVWRSVLKLFPEEKGSIKLWYVNAGEFVNKETCERLADKIEGYGVDRFALHMSHLDLPVQQSNVGDSTLYAAYVFEMPALVSFLRSCNGFYLK